MKSKYLITGGAGFIGSHVVDALLLDGESVTVLDIKPKNEATNLAHCIGEIEYVEGDVRDGELVKEISKDHDRILHLAAIVLVPLSLEDPVGSHDVNVNGTLNVFEAARQRNCKRVVYASSAAVYGDTKIVPVLEGHEAEPLSPYGLHKKINEAYGKIYTNLYDVPTIGLRFFNVFGERQDPSSAYSGAISIFVKKMLNGESPTVYGDGEATRDFVYVGNIVSACLLALRGEGVSGSVYNVGTGLETSVNKLIEVINSILETNTEANYVEIRKGDILKSCASIEKIQKEMGYKVNISFEDGLKKLFESS